MLEQAKDYIGEEMEWDKIKQLFPDCYVALDNYYTDGWKTKGRIIYVCKDRKEMHRELKEWAAKGKLLHSIYTTESEEINGLWEL